MSLVAVVKYSDLGRTRFLEKDQYRVMLETAFGLLAGETGYAAFIRDLFPGGVVGMKTNCLTAYNPTMKPLVDALSEILDNKAKIDNNDIIVWERTSRELKRAGFELNASSFGRRFLGTDANGIGYDDEKFYSFGKVNSLVTRILTRMVDHSVNLGVLKHHSIAGMSAGLKNMYGAVNNPNKYHGGNCSPYAAEINYLEPIRNKHRLTVIDAVRVQYDRGPGFDSDFLDYYYGLVVSIDPVAADRIALEILEKLRRDNGRPSLAETGKKISYLRVGQEIGLGISELSEIDLKVAVIGPDGEIGRGELF